MPLVHHSKFDPLMSGQGVGCAKTSALAPHVENFFDQLHPENQITLRTFDASLEKSPRIRRTGFMEFQPGGERFYPALILAARITLPHFSVSSAMNFPN